MWCWIVRLMVMICLLISKIIKIIVKLKLNYDHRIAMSFAVMGSKIGPLEK